VKENKGSFLRLIPDDEGGHHTQHLRKHLRAQLHSKLTSVTWEQCKMCGNETYHKKEACYKMSQRALDLEGFIWINDLS
jgi:hypothetical protein